MNRGKRNSDSVEPSTTTSKRTKKNEPSTPPRKGRVQHSSNTPSKSKTKSDGLIDFKEEIGEVTDNRYFHRSIMPLFEDIQDPNEFRVVSLLFWITYSTYQRGVSKNIRELFLKNISETCNQDWYQRREYIHVWHSEHDFVIKQYATAVMRFAQDWEESDAGKKYIDIIAKNRMKHLGRPEALTPSQLIELVHQDPPLTGQRETFQGIPFGIQQVLEIFSILGNISPLGEMEIGQEYERWFEYDMDVFAKSALSPGVESWGSKLTAVASSLVINLIQMHLGYQGKKFLINSEENCKEVLLRLPTPAWAGEQRYPFFPIEDKSLSEWISELEAKVGDPSSISVLLDFKQRNVEMAQGTTLTAYKEHARSIVDADRRQIQEENRAIRADIEQLEAETGFPMDEYQWPALPDETLPLNPRQITPFEQLLLGATLKGKVGLLHCMINSEIKRMEIMEGHIKRRKTNLLIQKQDIEKDLREYQKIARLLNHNLEDGLEIERDVDNSFLEKIKYEADPTIMGYMEDMRRVEDPVGCSSTQYTGRQIVHVMTPGSSEGIPGTGNKRAWSASPILGHGNFRGSAVSQPSPHLQDSPVFSQDTFSNSKDIGLDYLDDLIGSNASEIVTSKFTFPKIHRMEKGKSSLGIDIIHQMDSAKVMEELQDSAINPEEISRKFQGSADVSEIVNDENKESSANKGMKMKNSEDDMEDKSDKDNSVDESDSDSESK